jgi:dienelactone hydrolase
MVVCPGGGYSIVAIDHEGAQAARELNRHGIAAFVLRYRLKPNNYTPADSLVDAQRAVRWVRAHAEEYKIDPARLGIMGFSAGGHLASNVGTHNDPGRPDAADPVERQSSRPDFLVLAYPVIAKELYSGGFESTDLAVTPETPPTFLFHTTEDSGVTAENSIRFYSALLKAKVPAELHVFAAGPHGVGLGPGDPEGTGQWPALLANWIKAGKWQTPAKRVPVAGAVKVGGEPLAWGWVTLVPTGPDAHRRPVATAFLVGRGDGAYSIDAAHGPVPGPYRVEIRRIGTVLNGSPTLSDVEVVAGPQSGLAVEIEEGGEARIDLDLPAPG